MYPLFEFHGYSIYAPHFLSLSVLNKVIVVPLSSYFEWNVVKASPSIVALYKRLNFLPIKISFKKFISFLDVIILLGLSLNKLFEILFFISIFSSSNLFNYFSFFTSNNLIFSINVDMLVFNLSVIGVIIDLSWFSVNK